MAAERRAGFTSVEILVAAVVGLLVTGAAFALLAEGNRALARMAAAQDGWQEARAAAALWASEWRGAGYDPSGAAVAGVARLAPDTIELTADWNGNGTLLPTSGNPNERLAWAAAPGAWRRGVNGGPRLRVARPASIGFVFRAADGRPLGASPAIAEARLAEARVGVRGTGSGIVVGWTAGRRNPGP